MAGKPAPVEYKLRAKLLYEQTGSSREVANILKKENVSVSSVTIRRWLSELGIKRNGRWSAKDQRLKPLHETIDLPDFPTENVATEKLIDQACERFVTRKASYEAHTWFPIKVKENRPIGLLWFGDPHVDDNGCNWPVLRKHAKYCKEVDGLYGANIGDTTNNWSGRLIRLYAEQDASVQTARRFAKWFMLESGIKWLLWLMGNHDTWGDGAEVLAQMALQHGTQKIICHDWEARFCLKFPSDVTFKIFAAHDHPGHSMWNPLHGQVRAAKFSGGIDLIIAGHKHCWGVSQWEIPEQGSTPLMIRVRGYKHMDDHARHLGIVEQEEGQGILTIFNPFASTRTGQLMAFSDVEMGVDFLKFLRRKHR